MATRSKRFKSDSAKRHSVDLTKDSVNQKPFGWVASYKQRAILIRIVCPAKRKANNLIHHSNIDYIKFIDQDLVTQNPVTLPTGYHSFISNPPLSLEGFYNDLKKNHAFQGFPDVTLNNSYWNSIFSYLDACDYEYSSVDSWVTKTSPELEDSFQKLSKDQKVLLSAFEMAMKCDMQSGHGKSWITRLIHTLCTKDITLNDLWTFEPSFYDNTNTTLELIHGCIETPETQMLLYESNCENLVSIPSSSSSLLFEEIEEENLVNTTRHRIVPDSCIILPEYPGKFPLVTELKPANKEYDGLEQNIQQMLSKMVFQEVIFGLTMTPTVYFLSYITKTNDQVLLNKTVAVPLVESHDHGKHKLHLENIKALCTFVRRVMIWSIESKCSLKERS